jgi:hypothetical protein
VGVGGRGARPVSSLKDCAVPTLPLSSGREASPVTSTWRPTSCDNTGRWSFGGERSRHGLKRAHRSRHRVVFCLGVVGLLPPLSATARGYKIRYLLSKGGRQPGLKSRLLAAGGQKWQRCQCHEAILSKFFSLSLSARTCPLIDILSSYIYNHHHTAAYIMYICCSNLVSAPERERTSQ